MRRAFLLLLLTVPPGVAQNVTVEWDDVRQTIDGFGASDAWFADDIAAHPQREQIMDALFSTTSGVGLSILRQRIAPNPHPAPGAYTWTNTHWVGPSWTAQAAQRRGVPVIWGSAWSAPAWMKTNGDRENGGFLKEEHYDDYAAWLATWVEQMQIQNGVAYYGVSPQNEPGAKPWESVEWTADGFNVFLRDHLRPAFDARGVTAAVIAPEATGWRKVGDFADVFMADPVTSGFVDVVAGHAYDYHPTSTSGPTASYNGYGKPVWMTEWSYDAYPEDASIANGVRWAKNVWDLLVEAEVRAVHHWWLVSFKGDGRQQGLMNADTTRFSTTKRLYTIGQYSRFVRPGWQRIDATKQPHDDVYVAAFRDPATDQFALVAINEGASSRSVAFDFDGFTAGPVTPYRTTASQDIAPLGDTASGGGFSAALPPQSVTTFTGTGTPTSGGPRDAFAEIQVEDHDGAQGVETRSNSVGHFDAGDWMRFADVDFGDGAASVDLRLAVADGFAGKQVELRLDGPTGTLVGAHTVAGTGGWDVYRTQTASVTAPAGRHALYLVGAGGDGIANVDWVRFGDATSVATDDAPLPEAFRLDGAFPNPSAGRLALQVALPAEADVSVRVYDLLGREVLTGSPQTLPPGVGHRVYVDVSRLPAGVYVYRVEARLHAGAVEVATERLVIAR